MERDGSGIAASLSVKAERKPKEGRVREGSGLTWPTHAAGGIASLWLLAVVPGAVTGGTVGSLAALAAGAALMPDLDASRSKIRSLSVGPVRPFDPLGAMIYATLGHRGPLHSLPGLALFGLIAAIPAALHWGGTYAAALLLGYGSHLALDAMTRHGVPLVPTRGRDGRWGFRRRFHLLPPRLRFVTGSNAEDVFQAVLFGLSLLLLLKNLI